jgi:hypothetical protein
MYAWSDVTGECDSIVNNFAKIVKKIQVQSPATYTRVSDNAFNLKVVKKLYRWNRWRKWNSCKVRSKRYLFLLIMLKFQDGSLPDEPRYQRNNKSRGKWKWISAKINNLTGMRQKPVVPDNMAVWNSLWIFCFNRSP